MDVSSASWVFKSQVESPNKNSSFNSPSKLITDEKSLKDYLKDFENAEKRRLKNLNTSGNGSFTDGQSLNESSFWKTSPNSAEKSSNLSTSIHDHSGFLSRLKYQLSTALPDSLKAKSTDDDPKSPLNDKTKIR